MKAVTLKPHQEDALAKLHNGSILYGGVGSGKSITSLAYYISKVCGGVYGDFGSMRTPKDIYVMTTAKQRDNLHWNNEAGKFGITTHRDSSPSGVKLTVDSWNNIGKYTEVKDAFFIFDEQRLVGSGTWTKSFIKIAKSNQWILLSATPGDTWLDYIAVFVANGFYKNRTEFKRQHVVYNTFTKYPKVDRYIGVNRLVKHRKDILVHMPYETHTTRYIHNVQVDYDKERFDRVWNKRWNVYENKPLKDVADLFRVARKVVNSDSTRLEKIRELTSVHPKLIVFYNFDYELEILRTLASTSSESTTTTTTPSTESTAGTAEPSSSDPLAGTIWEAGWSPEKTSTSSTQASGSADESVELSRGGSTGSSGSQPIPIAEWNGHKHEEIPQTDRWIYLVQYTAGAEGWNCIETDAMVFYSLTYSYKQFHQAHGRIDRLNTPFEKLQYYVLRSGSMIDRAIWSSLKQKRSFNESNLVSHL